MSAIDPAARGRPPALIRAPLAAGPDGMPSRRPISPDPAMSFDPWILFTHFGPRELHETSWGFPAHPHKGFETVTYMLEGRLEHRDSSGGHAILEPGDVQWMTAGDGIVHSELPPDDFMREGGTVNGFQIWLNLSRVNKAAPAGFQMLRGAETPVAEPAAGVSVRVIAGVLGEARSPIRMLTPVGLMHARLAPGAVWTFEPAPGDVALVYVFGGSARIENARGGVAASDGDLAHCGWDGAPLRIAADGDDAADLLVLTGAPIGEPVAAYGPFVMNTREEIIAAIHDYQAGRLGAL
jgi:redox-sensitive bicupin YhaK (pirin superfamily)